MDNRLGQQIGSYRLIRELGAGGFSNVYLGEHIHLSTLAAIKVLRTQLRNEDIEEFRTEARTVAQLEHPNIVRVLDFGVENRIAFMVMPYAPNGTLADRHAKGDVLPLSPTNVLLYLKPLGAALQYAHDQKIIHRDIKPHNIFVGRNNEILLGDFGIALIAGRTALSGGGSIETP